MIKDTKHFDVNSETYVEGSQQEQEDENQSHKVLRNAETVELTGSFQWDYREAMEQHDVAEFCMQLFDAIEQSFE